MSEPYDVFTTEKIGAQASSQRSRAGNWQAVGFERPRLTNEGF